MTVPRIGVTLGDPGGIGPEVVLKCLRPEAGLPEGAYIVFGDPRIIASQAASLGLTAAFRPWREEDASSAGFFAREVPAPKAGATRGRPDADNGEASFRFFETAVAAARAGAIDAVVTAPVSKAAWGMAGLAWRGHTDYLEQAYPGATMSFWSEPLRVALFSHHVPLGEAVARVRRETLLAFLRNLDRSLAALGTGPSEILVAGLNPHAGEQGLLGDEDEREVRPAVEAARREGILVSGPYSADTVFLRAAGRSDAFVAALYHDQGLIPFKLLAFASGVNVTLGLPFVRTSPDHGTAYDLAGKGTADPGSMAAALRMAVQFVSASAS